MKYNNLINGKWKESIEEIEIHSPIDNKILGTVPAMSKEEVDEAMKSARTALNEWKRLAPVERAKYLYKAADIIEERKEEIGKILAEEVCKGYKSAVSEVVRTAELIRYTIEEGLRLEGEVTKGGGFEAASKSKYSIIEREPVGVVLAISPFNYPVNLAGSKIAPALIGGNTVVFKPATQGTMSGLELAKAFYDAGIPEGVLNTVTGRGSVIGDYLIEHPEVNFINFTGSTEIGQRIGKLVGMKPILLELGGKDAAIVLEDADLEKATKDIINGAFSYSGQRCTAIKRVLVMENVADKLSQLLQEAANKLKVGLPFEDATITSLIDTKAADKVERLINDALDKGAKPLNEIKREENLIYPVVFDNVKLDMDLAWEEPFGPVLPIIRIKSIEEAIEICNKSEYGLQSAIFTKDFAKAFKIAKELEVGTVQINNKTQRGPDNFAFLGIKGSGAGVQGIKYSIESMTRVKSIVFDI